MRQIRLSMRRHSALRCASKQFPLLRSGVIGLSFRKTCKEILMIRKLSFVCITLLLVSSARAKVVLKEIDYKAGDTDIRGYLAYDDAATGNRPGVLITHEWWGNDDYAKFRAQELAKLGYIAFAGDMFGGGKTTSDPKQ